jgi:hypothetical protein
LVLVVVEGVDPGELFAASGLSDAFGVGVVWLFEGAGERIGE